MKRIILWAAGLALTLSAAAQPSGQRPGPGGSGSGMRPGNPPSGMPAFGGEIDYEELEKYNAKQDKKLRKIIGDENFERWRAAHPHEIPKMPDPDFDLGSPQAGVEPAR